METTRNIDFIGKSKIFFTISAILFVLVLISIAVIGINLDIQFKGGMISTYAYDGELNFDDFQDAIESHLGTSVSIQESNEIATGKTAVTITMPGSLESQEMTALNDMILSTFAEHNLQSLSINNVDPVMGTEFLAKCLTAVVVASILMVVFVAFRFRKIGGISAGLMAVVALVHDIVIVFGVFILFGFSINDNFIAVVLTILGYSLNDTIVIYDRVRENNRLMGGKASVSELMNRSINQSFTRTLATSVTTIAAMIIVTVVAYLYNVSSIVSFSFPMVIGLISGTYSSICIAGPLWVKWREHKLVKNA